MVLNEREISGFDVRLVDPLLRHGLKVDVPMAHLARGQQLAWLSEIE